LPSIFLFSAPRLDTPYHTLLLCATLWACLHAGGGEEQPLSFQPLGQVGALPPLQEESSTWGRESAVRDSVVSLDNNKAEQGQVCVWVVCLCVRAFCVHSGRIVDTHCDHTRTRLCTHKRLHTHTHTHIHTYTQTQTHTQTNIHTNTNTHTNKHKHTHSTVHTRTHNCTYTGGCDAASATQHRTSAEKARAAGQERAAE